MRTSRARKQRTQCWGSVYPEHWTPKVFSDTESWRKCYHIVALGIRDATLVGIYVGPSISRGRMQSLPNSLQFSFRGRVAIIEDWNARSVLWGEGRNWRGNMLKEWATNLGLKIRAPVEHTFVAHQGTSTIDLLVTKAVDSSMPYVASGRWDGASEHASVIAKRDLQPTVRGHQRQFISKARRKRN